MKVLELFAGSQSFSKVARYLGHETFTVDWEAFKGINLAIDVEQMEISDIPFIPDIVWASPDCKTYSVAAISHHRPTNGEVSEYAKKCDRTNQQAIRLIKQWLEINPNLLFFIENPRGKLRKMPWMEEFKRYTVWYCQYGETRAKPTDIWTNCKTWTPRPECRNGNPNCHHEKAPRGSRTGTQGIKGAYNKSMIPGQLCVEILEDCLIKRPI